MEIPFETYLEKIRTMRDFAEANGLQYRYRAGGGHRIFQVNYRWWRTIGVVRYPIPDDLVCRYHYDDIEASQMRAAIARDQAEAASVPLEANRSLTAAIMPPPPPVFPLHSMRPE